MKLHGKSFNRASERFVGAICAIWLDIADESWREARVGARLFVAPPQSHALPGALAEIVCFHSKFLAGKVSGARLNDASSNSKSTLGVNVFFNELYFEDTLSETLIEKRIVVAQEIVRHDELQGEPHEAQIEAPGRHVFDRKQPFTQHDQRTSVQNAYVYNNASSDAATNW